MDDVEKFCGVFYFVFARDSNRLSNDFTGWCYIEWNIMVIIEQYGLTF